MKIFVNVTKTCIEKSRQEIRRRQRNELLFFVGDCCPIAEALKRRRTKFESVSSTKIKMKSGHHISLTQNAINFIDNFDSGYRITPFRFTIDIPNNCFKK